MTIADLSSPLFCLLGSDPRHGLAAQLLAELQGCVLHSTKTRFRLESVPSVVCDENGTLLTDAQGHLVGRQPVHNVVWVMDLEPEAQGAPGYDTGNWLEELGRQLGECNELLNASFKTLNEEGPHLIVVSYGDGSDLQQTRDLDADCRAVGKIAPVLAARQAGDNITLRRGRVTLVQDLDCNLEGFGVKRPEEYWAHMGRVVADCLHSRPSPLLSPFQTVRVRR